MKTLKEIKEMNLKDKELAKVLTENGWSMLDYMNYLLFTTR